MTTMKVIDPGFLTTIQDLGRPGLAHLGVPRSGALDPGALRLANRLVGNPESEAGLETTLMGVSVSFEGSAVVAVTGAHCEVRVGSRLVAMATPQQVAPGEVVTLGPSVQARSYLAVAGGLQVPPTLGSRSMDLLSGLGGPPLETTRRIGLGPRLGEPQYVDAAMALPAIGGELRVLPGPRADWFTRESLVALDGATYRVSDQSNRIGLRLTGPSLQRSRVSELPSEAVVLGAVQVPANGQPVIFLNDHPTTGGYPVIAVVHPADLPICAQARPGDALRLRLFSVP